VTVTGDAAGVHLSTTRVRAGVVRFTFSSTKVNGSQVDLFRLRRGATLAKLAVDVKRQFSEDPKTRARSTRDLTRHAVYVGAASPQKGHPATVTVRLTRGTYYAAELTLGFKASSAKALHVVGCSRHRGHLPHTQSRVTTVHDRFVVSGDLPAKGSIRVRNHSDSIHDMFILPVAKGTTDAKLDDYFAAGKDVPGIFLDGPAVGLDLVSPGRALVLGYSLPKGTYVLLCFVADDETGEPHFAMGMHKVVKLR
jgi:hypothetical protein